MEQHAFNWYATEKVKERMYDICKIVLCSKFYDVLKKLYFPCSGLKLQL